jgi:PadR family transcriptional regulator, regulatory protein PadR
LVFHEHQIPVLRPLDVEKRGLHLLLHGAVAVYKSECADFIQGRTMSPTHKSDALRGTLEMLVLKTLSLSPLHGWGIGQRIQQFSEGMLEVNQGSLYPALQRLERQGLIESEWKPSENNRRARYYRLTPRGRKALGEEKESWYQFIAAVDVLLGASGA